MIVRLTRRQFEFFQLLVVKHADDDTCDLFEPWISGSQFASKDRKDLIIPYIGGLCLANFAFPHVYSERGSKRANIQQSGVRAIQVLNDALVLHSSSPAFTGGRALGPQATIYPAWWRVDSDGLMWPSPIDNAEFVLLLPTVTRVEGVGITTAWIPSPQNPKALQLGLAVEATHRAFLSTGLQEGPLSPDLPASPASRS